LLPVKLSIAPFPVAKAASESPRDRTPNARQPGFRRPCVFSCKPVTYGERLAARDPSPAHEEPRRSAIRAVTQSVISLSIQPLDLRFSLTGFGKLPSRIIS